MACEKCWADAAMDVGLWGGSQVQRYVERLKEHEREMKIEEIKNNFTYHPPKSDVTRSVTGMNGAISATMSQIERYAYIRDVARSLAELINEACPDSREKSRAITKLEESVMWANASIARNE